MTSKANIKARLNGLLEKLSDIKQDMRDIRQLHMKFKFQSLLPNLPKAKTSRLDDENDKQNNFKCSNQLIRPRVNQETEKPNMKKHELKARVNELGEFKIINQDIENFKANMILQLSEIKSMEKKEQSLRRTNQKIKAYNSLHKRNYEQSLSKEKSQCERVSLITSFASSKPSFISSAKQKNETTTTQNALMDSSFSIELPLSHQNRTSQKANVLKCPRGHQFYEGQLNLRNEPHGNGRLKLCCPSVPILETGGSNLKDAQFYQGIFKEGKFHGFGTLSYKGGVKYVGEFMEGRRHGKGSLYYNGKAEVAKWDDDIFVAIM